MESFEDDPDLAAEQAHSLRYNALKSLSEMSGASTHAVWFFANTRNVLPPREDAGMQALRASGAQEMRAMPDPGADTAESRGCRSCLSARTAAASAPAGP